MKREAPKVKHFKPLVLQGVPRALLTPTRREPQAVCIKRRKTECSDSLIEKENINLLNLPKLFVGKCTSAFTKLNMLLDVVSKIDKKVESKGVRKKAMMDSQAMNLAQ